MEKKSQEFSMEDAMKLARSPAARQLMDALRAKNPDTLERAMAQAAAGDFSQAQKNLQSLLSDPALQKLLQQLGGSHG